MTEFADIIFRVFNGWQLAAWSFAVALIHFGIWRRKNGSRQIPRLMKASAFAVYGVAFLIVVTNALPELAERAILRTAFAGLLLVEFAFYLPEVLEFLTAMAQRLPGARGGDD